MRCPTSEISRQDGSIIYTRENAKAVQDNDGHTIYYEGAIEDITEFKRADGHTLWMHNDQWEGQAFQRSPGNLYSDVVQVHLDPADGFDIELDARNVIPPIPFPEDTEWVKRFRFQSPTLSEFWGEPIYIGLYAAAIIFFCFFYTALMYNSKDTADNLKKAGAFLPGIRPGAHTAEYIDRVLTRLTFWGSIYIAGVCLLPELVRMFYPSMPFSFGGTSLLILVVVTMDFMSQMQAHAMSHQYEGMMQKANLRNYGRSGQIR